jgi:eukaryotic-like serine/threonine-protein kinase
MPNTNGDIGTGATVASAALPGADAGAQPGSVLAGKYRIDRILGAGGMGIVVAARHLSLDDHVAIKFLLPEALGNSEAVERFAREARAATRIKSQHVARVSDVGKLENGAPYMVMEYLDGHDLSARLREKGPLSVAEAVEFVIQACDAIAEAHGLGIVHRDLKPANLFCVRGPDGLPSVKVLDFGISKATTISGFDMTRTAAVMGSPSYMSPEQMTSAKDVDARTDIWSMGIVLYELLAGRAPFEGETLPEVCVKIATNEPPPIRNFRPDLPDGLEAVILKCLEKDRANRFQNVGELVVALVEFGPKRARQSAERVSRIIQAAGLSKSALALPPSSDVEPGGTGTVASWGNTGARGEVTSRGRGKVVALAAAVAVCALIGVGAYAMRARGAATRSVASGAPAASSPSSPVAAATAAPTEPAVTPDESASATAAPSSAESAAASAAPAPGGLSVPPRNRATSRAVNHVTPRRATKAAAAKAETAKKAAAPKPATPAPAAKPPPAAPPRQKPNCNPPYTIAPNGDHVYKPQCL